MSIRHLFDHTVTVYRVSETRDPWGGTQTTWAAVYEGPAAVIPPNQRTIASYGAGEQPSGHMEVYLGKDADVQIRDGVHVTAGPEAGTKWRVVTVHTPRGHHTEARLEVYNGSFEEVPA